jgi:hypothetical protein
MKTINYPKSWADVKLVDYLRWFRSVKPYAETEEYSDKAILHGIFNFTNITEDEYLNLPEKEITDLKIKIATLLNNTYNNFLPKIVVIDDIKYGFIPSLDDMTYGEYLDLVTYTKKNMWEQMPTVMAMMYRPVTSELGTKYTIEKYNGTNEDRIEMFNLYLTMDHVFGALSFFLDLQKDLLIGTQIYLQEMLTKVGKKGSPLQMALAQNGMGTTQLQFLQEMISSNLIALQSSRFTNV